MRRLKTLTALGLVGVLVVGCGSSKKTEPKDQVVKLAWDADATTFDSTTENNADTMSFVNAQSEGLYRLDEKGKLVNGLAKDIDISDDKMVYTFTLRDTKWSNGEPLKAQDFVFAFQRLFDQDVPDSVNNRFLAKKGLLGLKNADAIDRGEMDKSQLGVKALDDKKLQLTLEDPSPIIGSILAYPSFFPLNEKFVKNAGSKYGTSVDLTLGCGPFKLVKWEANNTIAFEKNPGYYDADKIQVKGLDFKINTESTQRALSYQSGNVMFTKLTSELVDQYKGTAGFETRMESYLSYLSFNQNNPALKNVNLRKALATSFNKAALVDDILKDGSKVANHIIPEGLAKGPDGKDFRETAKSGYLKPDKKKAKEYYEKAKQELGKDSFSFVMTVGERDPGRAIAEYLKQEIEKNLPGVTINIDTQPSKTFYNKANSKQGYDILSMMWGPDYPYPTTFTDLWATGGTNNYSNYSSAKYDQLQKDTTVGKLLKDPEKRWEAFKDMEKMLLEDDAAVAPIYQRGWAGLVNPKLKGISYQSSGVKWIFRDVHIEE